MEPNWGDPRIPEWQGQSASQVRADLRSGAGCSNGIWVDERMPEWCGKSISQVVALMAKDEREITAGNGSDFEPYFKPFMFLLALGTVLVLLMR